MNEHDFRLFELLKAAVETTFRSRHPEIREGIKEWKGQVIVDFQEDLLTQVKGRISEKWFYTHIKGRQAKLPRIDMLNLLSRYAGFRNWSDFINENRPAVPAKAAATPGAESAAVNARPEPQLPPVAEAKAAVRKPAKPPAAAPRPGLRGKLWIAAAILVALLASGWIFGGMMNRHEALYTFCLVDADRGLPISGTELEIQVLGGAGEGARMPLDSNGCVRLNFGEAASLRIVPEGPYYRRDTIVCRKTGDTAQRQTIRVRTDDYAMMIHVFSTAKITDWKKRRAQLSAMIHEDAEIFQVYKDEYQGMEMYNKEDFIDKMTMPLESLRDVQIIDKLYDGDHIIYMKFIQKTPEE